MLALRCSAHQVVVVDEELDSTTQTGPEDRLHQCGLKTVVLKNRSKGEERLASSRYAANPKSWLMTRFWAKTSPLATPSN
jgi:hypothetical protein